MIYLQGNMTLLTIFPVFVNLISTKYLTQRLNRPNFTAELEVTLSDFSFDR